MKRSLLIPAIFLLSAASFFAQERPRYFDNFDTSRGVKVHYPPSPPAAAIDKKTIASPRPRIAQRHYLPSPPFGDKYKNMVSAGSAEDIKLVKKTAQVAMSVNDGLARQEAPRFAENTRLTMAAGLSMKGFSTGDYLVDSYIVDSSRRYGIDPLLIYSQMHQESSFKPRATSYKGASGLMQLMPMTARRMGVTNIYDPQQNIEGGVKYMRLLLDLFGGDVNLALAGYNAGEGAVMKYGYQIPPYNETQEYVRRISAHYSSISNPKIARYGH